MRATKLVLLAGISGLALQFAAQSAFAADMARKAPPIPAAPPTPAVWTWWIEGGGNYMSGDPFVPAFNTPAFDINAKRWGWLGGIGADYKFANSPWDVSADFRYMQNNSNTLGSTETATFAAGVGTGPNAANRKEHNWEADFMVGHDFGIGFTSGQVKAGVRVADIWGQTNGQAFFTVGVVSPPIERFTYSQTNHFTGAGPRAAIEGSIPLQGGWSVEYNGGVAALWGHSSANQAVTVANVGFPPPTACISGCPIGINSSSNNTVFNADAQGGLAYAFSQNAKISFNYRVDGYWRALRGFNPAGAGVNLDRVYSGPTVKLIVTY